MSAVCTRQVGNLRRLRHWDNRKEFMPPCFQQQYACNDEHTLQDTLCFSIVAWSFAVFPFAGWQTHPACFPYAVLCIMPLHVAGCGRML